MGEVTPRKAVSLNALYQKREKGNLHLFEGQFGKDTVFHELFVPSSAFSSRAKARLSVSGELSKPIIGLLDSDFSGIELMSCPLHFSYINDLILFLPEVISKFSLVPYDIKSRRGELKSIIVLGNRAEDSLMLRFILRSSEAISRLKKAVLYLQNQFPTLKVISANIQPVPHQIPEGKEEILLSSESLIWESYNGLKFALSNGCFVQATPEVASALYAFSEKILRKYSCKNVLDLYCGVGGFSLHAARSSQRVIGVELVERAIDCAKLSAKENGIENIEFYSQSLQDFRLSNIGLQEADTIICNPPRRGLDEAVFRFIEKNEPRLILYSSCNPQSLLKDYNRLSSFYQILEYAPFDMFPLTRHSEVLMVLSSLSAVQGRGKS